MRTIPPRRCFTLAALLVFVAGPATLVSLADTPQIVVSATQCMARADLEMAEDYIPHEYLHGETGQQAGVPMQGWNAAMFGAISFGRMEGSYAP